MTSPHRSSVAGGLRHTSRVGLTIAVVVAGILDVAPQRELVAQTASEATVPVAALRPGDALRLRVWREPDLSGDFMVDERGQITLPRLGQRRVSGIAIDSVRSLVIRDYGDILRDVTIEVTPLYRVKVSGAVRNPGLFTVDPTMSVADAISLAGGVSPQGRAGRVELVRDGRSVTTSLSLIGPVAELGLHPADELYVPERTWLSRNAGLVVAAISASASLMWAFHR
jgi:protein involved in polysaccharide export with SLBB domain